MPELPEVESVRLGLARHLPGRVFEEVHLLHPRSNRGQVGLLPGLLVGQEISGIGRRGKFMWLELAGSAQVCLVHLGMSGQMRVGTVESPHVRIRTRLSGGVELSFVDQRTFGYWRVANLDEIGHIAPDPLGPDFHPEAVARRLRKSRRAIKAGLLDQTVVSGIGNIYADEALWLAGINPARPSNRLLQREALALLEAAKSVMERALEQGGTSFDSLYVNVNGESGYFDRSLNAYGRGGKPCRRCGTALERSVVGGRGTHRCPSCQK
ncbi:5-hydroxymethyluracil DNA glycosylase [Corynebacterium phocae]|uniref:Formamidopyrimidine-DNA glycosylase n=1 Tax=Corynebacterium phocae TaxID=161895 RepID=A0A1L7D2I9_9CORY|nr:bifunctional DNA-formamidopyrimidine glycosylase/DNA-(apurinic or apyrimidinic site) lyase [Corynebacterium phocae]APT92287.1 5-hydroxymethyluracil DNA glycosylase [Corynebacterium phocae]KAA8725432.1 bifunctional DNA-formamidopyrimidine glycosylase/DNA-(apurinic or apyrimidinic site) lyase [Corynebacterium phocae]